MITLILISKLIYWASVYCQYKHKQEEYTEINNFGKKHYSPNMHDLLSVIFPIVNTLLFISWIGMILAGRKLDVFMFFSKIDHYTNKFLYKFSRFKINYDKFFGLKEED